MPKMKKIKVLIPVLFSMLSVFAQNNISIIPEPVKVTRNAGSFILPSSISINAENNPGLKQALADLKERLAIPTGYHVLENNSSSATIRIILNKNPDPELGTEGYRLLVAPKKVTITANQTAG